MKKIPQLSVRSRPGNPDHHLWNNNGTFWCHYTIHLHDLSKCRIRLSLCTHRVEEARELRDRLLSSFRESDCTVNPMKPL